MNFQSRSSSLSAGPQLVRRPSVSSRLSSAVSIAERGETQDGGGIAAQHQIEEEIAKIKRYEVRPAPARSGLPLFCSRESQRLTSASLC